MLEVGWQHANLDSVPRLPFRFINSPENLSGVPYALCDVFEYSVLKLIRQNYYQPL